MSKQKLCVSFSGGRTSAYMTKRILELYSDTYEIHVLFANTGQEHEKTLDFINNCDKHWGFGTVWLEAKVHYGERKASTHQVVDYQTCNRIGKPYHDVCKKYGLPSHAYLHCTRELKENPIKSYRKEHGINDCMFALGMRVDEMRRVKPVDKRGEIVYPLVDWFPTTKPEILEWFQKQPFDLEIPDYLGNCKWCFKKTFSKLIKIVKEHPDYFDFPRELEDDFEMIGSEKFEGNPRKLFRGFRNTDDIFKMALDKEQYELDFKEIIIDDAKASDCAESCEPFADGVTK